MDSTDTAIEFSRLLGPLRRAVVRVTRTAENLPDLPEAQIELLRVLADGPLTPRQTADRLRVAPSTVSNLVKTMRTAGLVERTTHPGEGRTALLTATDRAADLLTRYDRASARALAEGIDHLGPDDHAALRAALPALARLAAGVERAD
ncbi:MarR family winged helix-turn-helix transcriptional regulator [Streptomyces monticola]|uniref:MarR family winged helix-turn-helix transcriptional regulator n=1 Tax=Streptomyces monticola TaxID=2666263 RepID=A0ABW2JQV1_9ACTN